MPESSKNCSAKDTASIRTPIDYATGRKRHVIICPWTGTRFPEVDIR
jgi:hypothetical protein